MFGIGVVRRLAAVKRLFAFKHHPPVFTTRDLGKAFDEKPDVLNVTLNRLVQAGVLVRAARGVYVHKFAPNQNDLLEHIAKAIRRSSHSYVSLESALSQYSVISQLPQRLTVMTTGRKGVFDTPFGTIEFTHTQRSPLDIQNGCVDVGRPLRLASKETAYLDLKRVGQNLDLVDMRVLNDEEW